MKKLFLFLILFSSAFSQWTFSDFLAGVYSSSTDSAKNKLVDSFWTYAKLRGIPYIEGNTANFLWRGTAGNVYLSGDMNSWSSSANKFQKLSTTNLYYFSNAYEPDARLDYKFIVDGNWILDPNNPRTCSGGYGPNSELAMRGYVQPPEIIATPNVPQGSYQSYTIFSKDLNSNYSVYVFTPFGYISSGESYPVVYVQDGSEYMSLGSMMNVINNMIYENKVRRLIAVFIKPNNRNDEYAYSKKEAYEKFVTGTVVRFVDSLYRTFKSPESRGIMGCSFGGNISTFIAYRNPEIFGLCGNHSPAFWPNSYEVQNMVVNGIYRPVRFYLDWGTYEGLGSSLKPFRDSLIKKGYSVSWNEWHEGHSWGSWRAHTDNLLFYLFPPTTDVHNDENLIKEFELRQNYPNPFNPSTRIEYQIPTEGYVSLKVFDVLGTEIAELENGFKQAAKYSVEWNASKYTSGIYYYELCSGNFREVKKMILIK